MLTFLAMRMLASSQQKTVVQKTRTVAAELVATELLEFFRAQTPERIKEIMSFNPFDPDKDLSPAPYRLCAHVNLANRAPSSPPNQILNLHPLAALGSDSALRLLGNAPNRYFQIFIAEVRGASENTPITIRTDLCNRTLREIYLYGKTPQTGETVGLSEYERLLVSVGVSWEENAPVKEVKHVALSSIIP